MSKCHQSLNQIAMDSPLGAAIAFIFHRVPQAKSLLWKRMCIWFGYSFKEWPACSNLNQFLLEKFSLEGLS